MSDRARIANELTDAVDQLHDSLRRAADASARIRTLLPRISRASAMFEELEAMFVPGRQSPDAAAASTPPRPAHNQLALFMPNAAPTPTQGTAQQTSAVQPASDLSLPVALKQRRFDIPGLAAAGEELISFRLEFENRSGPLDLRAVDDAVSEHPAVRDVALLDYDGRRASLKVWIIASASVADVQQTLVDRAGQIIGRGNDVSIIALENAA